MGQRTRSTHRATHRQSTGRDERRPSGLARVATVCPQTDERGIRSLREQDACVAIQTHDRGVSPELIVGAPSTDRHPVVLQRPRLLHHPLQRHGRHAIERGRCEDQTVVVSGQGKRGRLQRLGADHGQEDRELSHSAKRSADLQSGCHRTSLRDQ